MARNWTIVVVIALNLVFGITAFKAQAVPDSVQGGIACVLDIEVQTRCSEGEISTKRIQREFVLQDGMTISEDLSVSDNAEFLDASLVKDKRDKTISLKWFADVEEYGSVEFATSVLLEDGDHSGRATGSNTVTKSNITTRTNFKLTCTQL